MNGHESGCFTSSVHNQFEPNTQPTAGHVDIIHLCAQLVGWGRLSTPSNLDLQQIDQQVLSISLLCFSKNKKGFLMKITSLVGACLMLSLTGVSAQTPATSPVGADKAAVQTDKEKLAGDKAAVKADKDKLKADEAKLRHDRAAERRAKKTREQPRAVTPATPAIPATPAK